MRPFLMPESHYVEAEINKSLRNITMASTAWKTICTSICLKSQHFYSSSRVFTLSCFYKRSTTLLYITYVIFYYSIKYDKKIQPKFCIFYPAAFFDLSNLEIHPASFLYYLKIKRLSFKMSCIYVLLFWCPNLNLAVYPKGQ